MYTDQGPELAGARWTEEDEEANAGDVPGRPGEVTAIPLFTRISRGTSSSCGGDAGDVPGQPGEVTARQFDSRLGLGTSSSWCEVAGGVPGRRVKRQPYKYASGSVVVRRPAWWCCW